METIKPVVLLSLDGWGVAPPSKANAITQARTPNFDELISHYPVMTLQASGEAVGLKMQEMGNSEVGHLSMGCGRIVFQTLPRIHNSILDGTFFEVEAFLHAKEFVQKNKSALHLIGLLSDGGIHSHIDHLFALLDFCKLQKITNVYVHAILDGRDARKDSGAEYIKRLLDKFDDVGFGKLATLSGRYYAMDRDRRWDRIELAYVAMTAGKSLETFEDPLSAVNKSYKKNIFDEEFKPSVIVKNGKPITKIVNKDAVIFFNYRSDRARQLSSAFTLPSFSKFHREVFLDNVFFIPFTQYDKDLPFHEIAFPPENVKEPLAKVLSDNGLQQLHIAETEKYAHVTYFFNGGKEQPFEGEERMLVPSPSVSSYDKVPQMSAYETTNKVIEELSKNKYSFVVINYANADMVGHTGNLPATIQAVEHVDQCIGKLVEAVLKLDGHVIISADHGNAESLINQYSGDINKEHTTNAVPCLIIGNDFLGKASEYGKEVIGTDLSIVKPSGFLVDIAPTILKIMNLPIPESMTGTPLI